MLLVNRKSNTGVLWLNLPKLKIRNIKDKIKILEIDWVKILNRKLN